MHLRIFTRFEKAVQKTYGERYIRKKKKKSTEKRRQRQSQTEKDQVASILCFGLITPFNDFFIFSSRTRFNMFLSSTVLCTDR